MDDERKRRFVRHALAAGAGLAPPIPSRGPKSEVRSQRSEEYETEKRGIGETGNRRNGEKYERKIEDKSRVGTAHREKQEIRSQGSGSYFSDL